ncbi:MAG: hypothetical protein PCFJNLEI_02199 [Verrucomicrobiae bacterium]|nr:hypothetical protein [Verrucomicrobiae bacterium]
MAHFHKFSFVGVRVRCDDVGQIVVVMMGRDVEFTSGHVFQPVRPLGDALTGFAGDLEDRRSRVELAEVSDELVEVEIGVGQEINFVEHERADLVEEQRIFAGFVVAFGDAEDADFAGLAEIELGRAGDVADVLDQDEVQGVEVERIQAALDEWRFEVTCAAREKLDNRHVELGNPVGVARGGDVAFENADPAMGFETRDGQFQERGFPGTRGADEIDGGDLLGGQSLAQFGRDGVVGFEDVFQNSDIHILRFSTANATTRDRLTTSCGVEG